MLRILLISLFIFVFTINALSEDRFSVNYYDLSANRDLYDGKEVSLYGVLTILSGDVAHFPSYYLAFSMEQVDHELGPLGYRLYFTDEYNNDETLKKYIGKYVFINGIYRKPNSFQDNGGMIDNVGYILIINNYKE